jgi:phosphohistidine swiveling domain-containing protein
MSQVTLRPATASTRDVVALDDAREVARHGGKAARLARARALGHTVPDGVVVPAAALRSHLGRGLPLEPADHGLSLDDPAALATAAEAFAAAVRATPVDAALLDALLAALEPRGGLAAGWVVRSSGVGEDGRAASFAGQLDSVAGVTTRAELERALVLVWCSGGSARALAYQLGRGARLGGVAILVQRLVPARAAGVLFSRHPDPAARESLLVEWVAGPSHDLVQGRVEPARATLDRDGAGGELLADAAARAALGEGTLERLRDLGLALEAAFGAPQDVEWVVDGEGALFLVQSRDQTEAAVARSPGARRYTSANVAENFPAPVTPLLASFVATGYEHLFRGLGEAFGVAPWRLARVEHELRHAVGFPGGRVHYDLTSIQAVLRAAPFGDALGDLFERYVGATPAPSSATEREAPATRWRDLGSRAGQTAELLVIVARVVWLYRDLEPHVARFEERVRALAADASPARLAASDTGQLVLLLRRIVDVRRRWTDAGLADVAAMVTTGLLRRMLERGDDAGASLARLLAGLEELASAAPVDALWALSRRAREGEVAALLAREPDDQAALAALEAAPAGSPLAELRRGLEEWLEAWGFRCSGELLLVPPSFQEEPWRALALVRAYARDGGESPRARAARQADARRAAVAELAARSGGRVARAAFARLLRATHASIALRERARLEQARLYRRLRGVVLALGARLADRGLLETADDAWFLGWQELDGLASGGSLDPRGAAAVAALRRSRHALHPGALPEVLEVAPGEAHPLEATGGGMTAATWHASGARRLVGTPGAPGRVTAPARVLEHVGEAGRLARGDVLVVAQTDPGWAAALFLAGGLVVERGGLLSHGAIVAREYGLPSVLGVPGATRAIPDGARVTVDGDAGRVEL